MILGVIPARYASTRFPGKPLADIKGRSMIRRVYDQVCKASLISKVVVATDDERIFQHVKEFNGQVVMTSPHHPSGTDRCCEALMIMGEGVTHVINIQGDEPFIDPDQINLLASALMDPGVMIATLVVPVTSAEILFNENNVKAVLNEKKEAMYFSRSPVPFMRGIEKDKWHLQHSYYRHIGMYGYRADVLKEITKLQPSSLEQAESLEQLRWLQNGYRIRCIVTDHDNIGIDTPKDLERVLGMK
jgi:3-deoxy-manno-octulosonate cytidylyltransferase (CMP-KDO synthetase)